MEQEPRNSNADSPSYEPPRVEQVIDREDLEREVHYAGFQTISGRDV